MPGVEGGFLVQKLQVFAVRAEGAFRLGLIRNPGHLSNILNNEELDDLFIITPPQPSTLAHTQLRLWQLRLGGKLSFFWRCFHSLHAPDRACIAPCIEEEEQIEVLARIKGLVAGRLVTEGRLISTLRRQGVWPSEITHALDLGVYRGELLQFPGFSYEQWGRCSCSRCGSEEIAGQPCSVCGRQDCLFCLSCAGMGPIRGCDTFITSASPIILSPARSIQLELSYGLTPAQREASLQLLHFWQGPEQRALVWAACGAGKTEVTFPLIRQALQDGAQVLFAIPRSDIVREMTERLRNAFPGVTVASHYGGQPWLAPGNLVVATTHQVLGLYRRFQLAILDEVDAFPYQGSEMLRFGLQRAITNSGRLVEMTATPSRRRDYGKVITIPARYHGYRLPEPRLIAHNLPHWEQLQPEHLPSLIMQLLRDEAPWLVFAPTIAACGRLREVLSAALRKQVGLCHSKKRGRSAIIERFREGKVDVLVTTSVLERGVNFPGVQVAIFYADHNLYNVSTLVQIAGRVGRAADCPRGLVFFVGSRVSVQMKKALRLIQTLNKEAREKGLLSDETGA